MSILLILQPTYILECSLQEGSNKLIQKLRSPQIFKDLNLIIFLLYMRPCKLNIAYD